MNHADSLIRINSVFSELSKRHRIADWRLDDKGRSRLQLASGHLVSLELAPDGAILMATCVAVRFDAFSTGKVSELVDDLNAELVFDGTLECSEDGQGIVCVTRIPIDLLHPDRLERMLGSLVTIAVDVGDAISAEDVTLED